MPLILNNFAQNIMFPITSIIKFVLKKTKQWPTELEKEKKKKSLNNIALWITSPKGSVVAQW